MNKEKERQNKKGSRKGGGKKRRKKYRTQINHFNMHNTGHGKQ